MLQTTYTAKFGETPEQLMVRLADELRVLEAGWLKAYNNKMVAISDQLWKMQKANKEAQKELLEKHPTLLFMVFEVKK